MIAYLKMKNSISPKFQEDLSHTIKEISNGNDENEVLNIFLSLIVCDGI